MSWLDPARLAESDEDRALREELRGLLGGPSAFFPAEVTPELIALAEDLRREAERRRHTSRSRPSWFLMAAAALPFVLALGGLGIWGYQQKQRADVLAKDLARQDQDHRQQLVAVSNQLKTEREIREEYVRALQKEGPKIQRRLGKELVIPVDRSPIPAAADTQQVKAH